MIDPCAVCNHEKWNHDLQPRPVLCHECARRAKSRSEERAAVHVFRGAA